ncbi:MAG: helix-turn-helix transcriptional regulator [Oscillospiraceae bacterium]|nr:helix-turn-helix transcriptional regulator [Oscillospiraceae bacterium]
MFFKRIADLRIDNDLTQQNIADYLGCKREVYRRYETGIRTIPIDFLIKLADLYGVSIDYLLEHTQKNTDAVSQLKKKCNDIKEQKNE